MWGEAFSLGSNFPNPFNPETSVSFELPQASHVRLEIYNIAGQKVRTVLDAERPAGYHNARWDGRNDQRIAVASGVYIYRITAGSFAESRRMTLLKSPLHQEQLVRQKALC